MSSVRTWEPRPYRSRVERDWIDYNGHMRDAYYCLMASACIDDLMDQLGLDKQYRVATGGTLYTLEMHLHYLHEVKLGEGITIHTHLLGADSKRIHVRCDLECPRFEEPAATIEMMLLHVNQRPTAKATPLPPVAAERLAAWQVAVPQDAYGSRAMVLKRRPSTD
jgi:acyl-CoA thioester hydrolase